MASIIETVLQQQKDLKGKRFKIKIAPKMRIPLGIERRYQEFLNQNVIRNLRDLTRSEIFPILPGVEEEAGRFTEQFRLQNTQDAFADDIAGTLAATRIGFDNLFTEASARKEAERIAFETSLFNRTQLNNVLKDMIGVDVFFDEPFLEAESLAFVESNVSLIKTIPEQYFSEVEEVIFRGARQGIRHEEIAKEIRGRFKVAKSRAAKIARDQVNKFNGKLNQLRQESVGIEGYTWRTLGDERVRPVHVSLNGKKFKWDKPPSEGHPGEPIQCRCYAEPDLTGLL
jgi:SPP1 gp7 family putative phage head morphogenesis protein